MIKPITNAVTKVLTSKIFVIGVVLLFGLMIVGSMLSQPLSIWGTSLGSHDVSVGVTHEFTITSDKDILDIIGHIHINQEEISTGWKPSSTGALSEAVSIDVSTVELDWENLGVLTVAGASLEYWYEWYLGPNLLLPGQAEYANGQPIVNPGNIHTMIESIENDEGDRIYSLGLEPDIYLKGQPDGILTCVLKADITTVVRDPFWNLGLPDIEVRENEILGYFNSILRPGFGLVQCGGALPDIIAEGQEVKFLLQTGFSHGNEWTVFINNPREEGKIEFTGDGFTGQDNFGSKIVSWTVPLGWFIPGGQDQEVRIELYSHLWLESWTTFFTIDDPALAPTGDPSGVITSIDGTWEVGSTMTIHLKGVPNEETNERITGFWLYVYYGSPGSFPSVESGLLIINKEWITADINGEGIKGFMIPDNKEGQISIKASAVDIAGRTSLSDFYTAVAFDSTPPYPVPDDSSGDLPGDVPDPNPEATPEYPFETSPLVIGLFIAGIILSIVTLVVIYIYFKNLFIPWGFILAIVIFLLFIIPAVLIGNTPGFSAELGLGYISHFIGG